MLNLVIEYCFFFFFFFTEFWIIDEKSTFYWILNSCWISYDCVEFLLLNIEYLIYWILLDLACYNGGKPLFHNINDIAVVNGFILCQQHHKKITQIWWHWNDIHNILFWTGRNLFERLWVLKNMLNLLPLEFINLLEIWLQSKFHNFLIQKGIVKYAITKTKKD